MTESRPSRPGSGRWPYRWRLAFTWAVILLGATLLAPMEARAAPLSTPELKGPIGRTDTTIGVRFERVPESDATCQPDIGYQVRGGAYADWHDVGGFPNAPCDDPDPGYKFSGLTPSTSYRLSVRAYRIVDGTLTDFSPASTITATTLTGSASPTAVPTPSASAVPTVPPATVSPWPGILVAAGSVAVVGLLLLVVGVGRRRGTSRATARKAPRGAPDS